MADPTAGTATFEEIVGALNNQQMVSYVDVLTATLLLYEIIINLDTEITHIWMRKWSFFTVLYILQRYLPLFDTVVLVLHHNFGEDLSTNYCTLNYRMAGWSFLVGIVLSEVILTLRVWAVWRRSIPVAIGLVVFFLGCWVSCIFLFAQFMNAVTFAPFLRPNLRGCSIAGGSDIVYLCWVLWMVYDTGTFVMILVPGIAAYRSGRSELIKTLYQDGVIYYAILLVISMINVIVVLTLPPDFTYLLAGFGRGLHSLLTSRAILHIRQVAWRRSTYQTISQIQFTQNDHGNHSSFLLEQRTRPIHGVESVN